MANVGTAALSLWVYEERRKKEFEILPVNLMETGVWRKRK